MKKTTTAKKAGVSKKASARKAAAPKKVTERQAYAYLRKDKRIEVIDDERRVGNSLIINLKDGFRFNDEGEHIFGEDSALEAWESMKRVQPCGCDDCLKALGKLEAVAV